MMKRNIPFILGIIFTVSVTLAVCVKYSGNIPKTIQKIKNNSQIPYYFNDIKNALKDDNPGWEGNEEQIRLTTYNLIHGKNETQGLLLGDSYITQFGLQLSGQKLKNLKTLEKLPLTLLTLEDTGINEISALQKLPLIRLWLIKNKHLEDISGIRGNKVLYLGFEDNPKLKNFETVGSLSNLRSFSSVRQYGLSKIDFLSELKNLEDVMLTDAMVYDITPLKDKPICRITIEKCKVNNLNILKNLPLKTVVLMKLAVDRIDCLKGKKLEVVWIIDLPVSDISVFKEMPLRNLVVRNAPVKDISSLKGMPIMSLSLRGTKVSDLIPLAGVNYHYLDLANTPIKSLKPLKGSQISFLDISGTKVFDLSPLIGMKLKSLTISNTPAANKKLPSGMDVEYLSR